MTGIMGNVYDAGGRAFDEFSVPTTDLTSMAEQVHWGLGFEAT